MNAISYVNALKAKASECAVHIKESEATAARREVLIQTLEIYTKDRRIAAAVVDYQKRLKKDLEDYNAEKKKKALAGIQASILSAKTIVPDAGPIRLDIGKTEAQLVDDDDCALRLMEGDAIQAVVSYFMRNVCLANSPYMPDVLMDEIFAPLNAETSERLSSVLSLFARDRLIILIEQKDEIFSNADTTVYTFTKVNGVTIVQGG